MSFNFGTPQAQQNAPAFNFATPPAGGTSGSSFAFGGPTTSSAPTATVQPLSAPAFGYLGSTTTAPSSAPSFGFGTPTPNTATVAPLSFGASVPSTSFGGVVQPTLGLAQPLGLASTGSATVGFAGLGQSTATMTPSTLGGGLSFGAAATSKPSSSLFGSGGLGQSSIAATSGIPSFGQPSATSASAFGLPAATSASAFGLGAATSTPGALSFGGLPPTATAAPSFALGGVSSTIANTACLGLGGTGSTALTVSQSKPTSVGLGGTLSAFGNSPANSAANDPKSGSANNIKDTPIPNELLETVEEFKKFVKEERSTSSDIAHVSPKIHNKIAEEISGMNRLVSGLVSGLSRNCSILDMIKREAAQEILNAEVGQRTRDTPPGLQYENIGPYEYFGRLLSNFESQMLHYRRQIEETEQHLQSMANGQALTPEDVARALQKLHTAFVGLAGQYQTVHEAVRGQAEAFVQWHRQRHGTSIEVFDSSTKGSKPQQRSLHSTGPSPFNGHQDLFAKAKAALLAQPQQQPMPLNQPSFMGGTLSGPPTLGLTTNPFGTPSLGQTSSLFSTTAQQPSQLGMSTLGFPSATATPGLLGSTMSPFGNSTNNQTSLFQTGGKRGKH